MTKEDLKAVVEISPNYTAQMKQELKAIIEAGRSIEEICVDVLVYFAAR